MTLPMVGPGVVASLMLTFTVPFEEFILAFFRSGTEPTLSMSIWGQLRYPQAFPSILALSSLIILGSCVLMVLGQWINKSAFARTAIGDRP